MSERNNTAIAREAYDKFKKGDIQALLTLMSDDIIWELPEIEDVPIAGSRSGQAAVGEFFAMVARDQDVIVFEPREFVAEGDKVVALGHYQWRVRDTDREFATDFVHIFTIRNGKIVAFREHFDTAAVASAYQKAMIA